MHWKHDRVQVRGANRSGSNSISEQNQWSVQSTLWETRCARVSGRASAGCAERKQSAAVTIVTLAACETDYLKT